MKRCGNNMSDVYMQTTSGKVKLATAEEVDNMTSSISGGLGGTLIGTTTAYINVTNGKSFTTTVPDGTDYVVIKPISLNGTGSAGSSGSYWILLPYIGNTIVVYNNGSGFIPSTTTASNANNSSINRIPSNINELNITYKTSAKVTFTSPIITFTSMCDNANQYTYVNIECYKFN